MAMGRGGSGRVFGSPDPTREERESPLSFKKDISSCEKFLTTLIVVLVCPRLFNYPHSITIQPCPHLIVDNVLGRWPRRRRHRFLFLFDTILAAFWAGSSFAAFISGLIPDVFLTFVSGIAIIFYFLFLCGFLVARNRLPKYWVWLHYISLIKYPYEAILQNEFLDPMEGYVMGVQLFDQTTVGTLPAPLKSEFLASMGRILGRNITIYCQRRVGGLIGLGLWAVVVGEKVEVLENRVHRINFSQM
ncbi:hypothetical protein F3Y22_tig00113725pilonHSYRG00281 [Hibiscus syriacus]|uniref:ABC-2 type transporter transmembrane domain-containing protein n=1 Tax=Hibiscus syriacus TaxID=106335 RepID=A0A6A2XH36_HIBSY|nr:hypothetical protein F3Y22_tig00113725pilonHSYRG00281 [Hibiscus syriacus]